MKVTLQSTLACIDTRTQQQERDGEEQINTHPFLYLKVTHTPHSSYISHLTLIHKHFTHSPPLQQNVTINSVTLLFAVGTTANTIGGLTMCCIQKHKNQPRFPPPSLFTQSGYSTHPTSPNITPTSQHPPPSLTLNPLP